MMHTETDDFAPMVCKRLKQSITKQTRQVMKRLTGKQVGENEIWKGTFTVSFVIPFSLFGVRVRVFGTRCDKDAGHSVRIRHVVKR